MAEFVGNEVSTVSTTPQTALAAPAAGKNRELISIKVYNADTAAHVVTVQHAKGATDTIFAVVNLAANGGIAHIPGAVILDATDETIEIFSDGAASVTEPKATVAAFEVTP